MVDVRRDRGREPHVSAFGCVRRPPEMSLGTALLQPGSAGGAAELYAQFGHGGATTTRIHTVLGFARAPQGAGRRVLRTPDGGDTNRQPDRDARAPTTKEGTGFAPGVPFVASRQAGGDTDVTTTQTGTPWCARRLRRSLMAGASGTALGPRGAAGPYIRYRRVPELWRCGGLRGRHLQWRPIRRPGGEDLCS